MSRDQWIFKGSAGRFHVYRVERMTYFITDGAQGEVVAVRVNFGTAWSYAMRLSVAA